MIEEIRVTTHSHIHGLGLTEEGVANYFCSGFVGQKEAREACGVALEMIREKKMAGKAILLTGAPGSGKTALAIAIAHEQGTRAPFCIMVGSEVYSTEVKKTSVLVENLRRSIGLRIKESREVYEGEVVEIASEEIEPWKKTGNNKILNPTIVCLKTTLESKRLRIDTTICHAFQKENVNLGDVVCIEAENGALKRLGKCNMYATEFDLESEVYVPLPQGKVVKTKQISQELSLYDLDFINVQPRVQQKMHPVIGSFIKSKKTEITDKLRLEVNKVVNKYIEKGIAEVVQGVLFIDEANMLDLECFAFLNKALESSVSPIIILATNRGITKIRGTDISSPHGIPLDLLDRLLIIRTITYKIDEMIQILSIKVQIEKTSITEESLVYLGQLGELTSIRHAMLLITPAMVLAKSNKHTSIHLTDVKDVHNLFQHANFSVPQLVNSEYKYIL